MTKNDKKLILTILFVAIVVFIALQFINRGEAYKVVVTVNGNHYGEWLLNEEHTIDINGTNLLFINGITASVIVADCLNQICVNHISINQVGESIVCLPNRVVITITSD